MDLERLKQGETPAPVDTAAELIEQEQKIIDYAFQSEEFARESVAPLASFCFQVYEGLGKSQNITPPILLGQNKDGHNMYARVEKVGQQSYGFKFSIGIAIAGDSSLGRVAQDAGLEYLGADPMGDGVIYATQYVEDEYLHSAYSGYAPTLYSSTEEVDERKEKSLVTVNDLRQTAKLIHDALVSTDLNPKIQERSLTIISRLGEIDLSLFEPIATPTSALS